MHVAYQTSGNIAVADEEALRFANFVIDYNAKFDIQSDATEKIYKKVVKSLPDKKPSEIDIPEAR